MSSELERAVERHMRAFRRHGDIGPITVAAQFLALQVVMAVDALEDRGLPTDVRADLLLFLSSAIEALNAISPGYRETIRALSSRRVRDEIG